MEVTKTLVERIYVRNITEEYKKQLISDGFNYISYDDYTNEMIYEKEIFK